MKRKKAGAHLPQSASCLSYRRHVKADGTKFLLTIQRVLCQNCGRSNALFPASLVPCSQIPLEDHVSLIEAFEEGAVSMYQPAFHVTEVPPFNLTDNSIYLLQYILNKEARGKRRKIKEISAFGYYILEIYWF